MKQLFNDGFTFAKYSLKATKKELLTGSSAHRLLAPAPVDLPHDWMISQVNNLYEDSIGCYRKRFTIPKGSRCALGAPRYFLRFDGVYLHSRY